MAMEITSGAPAGSPHDWLGVTDQPLPVADALAWATRPECGAVVVFCGTVRDHSEGRDGVRSLEYEAFAEQVVPRLAQVAAGARERWPDVGRLVLLHRTGLLAVGEVSVVVVASTPHRAEAFDAARFAIDTLKHAVPIWKRETWADGTDWGICAHEITEVPGCERVGSPFPAGSVTGPRGRP